MKRILSTLFFISTFCFILAKENTTNQYAYIKINYDEYKQITSNCNYREVYETEEYVITEIDGKYYIYYK